MDGYYLSSGDCQTTCPNGQYGKNGVCDYCDNTCLTCSDKYFCLSC